MLPYRIQILTGILGLLFLISTQPVFSLSIPELHQARALATELTHRLHLFHEEAGRLQVVLPLEAGQMSAAATQLQLSLQGPDPRLDLAALDAVLVRLRAVAQGLQHVQAHRIRPAAVRHVRGPIFRESLAARWIPVCRTAQALQALRQSGMPHPPRAIVHNMLRAPPPAVMAPPRMASGPVPRGPRGLPIGRQLAARR